MDLVIKINSVCQFKCGFCSSPFLSDSPKDNLSINYVFDFLKRFPETRTIICNGGDPILKMNKPFLEKLIEHLDRNNYPTSIAITSNLWDFKLHPERWVDIFKNKRVGVTTSFQYDDPFSLKGRLKPDFTLYTEKDFWEISDLFLEKVGYRPDFISVITDENKHLAIKNVELAKKMSNGIIPKSFSTGEKTGVECKLNYVMASGSIREFKTKKGVFQQGASKNTFKISDIYEIYLDVWKLGLHPWEYSTREMMKVIKDSGCSTSCPLNKKCDEGIRVLNPDNSMYSCPAMSDDREELSAIDFNQEIYGNKFFTPIQDDKKYTTLKKSCINCPMFNICNGCKKTISDYHRKGGLVIEDHCKKMKELSPEILRANGFKEDEITNMVTPYKQEYFSI